MGAAIAASAFLNLAIGQPSTDSNYAGAAPASYVDGIALTCDPPPSGYTLVSGELVDLLGQPSPPGLSFPGTIYPHYVKGQTGRKLLPEGAPERLEGLLGRPYVRGVFPSPTSLRFESRIPLRNHQCPRKRVGE